MNVNSPEVFLKGFNNRILELLNSTEILDNSEIRKKLQLIYRKLAVSEILFEKYIVSISGLQGVGKTTLIKQIYSIPDEFLPENIGRGEQLPVLITESDVKEITLNVIRLKEGSEQYVTVKENIDKEEFFKISKDPNPTDLIIEMKVPNKIFNSDNKSFLLLPGFEDTKNEREDLVYHSLISSATCLFLFNATGLASKSNKNILEEINVKFENAKPIFLATFSDESEDENAGLKKNLVETFKLQNEEDRVICVGTGKYKDTDVERIDDWLPKLKQSLGKYSHTSAQFRKSQMENLRSIIEDEVGLILEEIEEVNDRRNLTLDVRQLKVQEPLELLDKQIKKIRNKYSKKLGEYLDGFTVKPIDGIKDIVENQFVLKKLKKVTIGSSLSDIRKFEADINNCWNTSNGYGVNELHAIVLNDLLSKEFKFHNDLKLTPGAERKELLGDLSQPENTDFIVSQEIVDDVITLFQPDDKVSVKFSDKFNSSIKVLPLLYMDILRMATIQPNRIELGQHDSSPNDKIQEIFGDADFLQSKTSLIGPAVTAILGIDAIDGQMDTVGALSSALGVSSATIATSLVVGAGVIGAGIFVKSVITQINKAEIEDTAMANTVIQGLKDRYYALYISNYDDIMDDLRDFIEDKLMERHHLDKGVGRREFLLKTVANVREDRYQLSQQLNRQLIL